MALEGTDLLVVQKQSGDNGMRKLTVSDLSTFVANEQPISFQGTANATVAGDEPASSKHVDGYLFINNATTAGDFAWTAGTAPFSGTIYPNASVIWQTPTGWAVTNNQPATDVGVTSVTGSEPITVNNDNAATPIVSVSAATTLTVGTNTSGVVTVATDADVASGTGGVVVTAAQLATTNAAIIDAGGGTVVNVTGEAPIVITGTASTNPKVTIEDAKFTAVGAVKLQDDSVAVPASTVDDAAATPKYVDSFYLVKDFSSLANVEA